MIFEFLNEFSLLTRKQQQVFIFCAKHKPLVFAGTSDLADIALSVGQSYKQVNSALHAFAVFPTLSQVVRYIPRDVHRPRLVSLDAIFCWEVIR